MFQRLAQSANGGPIKHLEPRPLFRAWGQRSPSFWPGEKIAAVSNRRWTVGDSYELSRVRHYCPPDSLAAGILRLISSQTRENCAGNAVISMKTGPRRIPPLAGFKGIERVFSGLLVSSPVFMPLRGGPSAYSCAFFCQESIFRGCSKLK